MRRLAAAALFLALALSAGAQQDPRELVKEGVLLMERGKAEDAEGFFRRAAALAPQDALAFSWHGRALLALRQEQAAAEALEKALSLDDAKPALVRSLKRETLDALALAWALQKNYSKARAVYARAVAFDPAYANFRYNLACVCALDGDRAGALASLGAYLALSRSTPDRETPVDASLDPDFKGLWGDPAFEGVLREKQATQPDDTAASALVRQAGGDLARGKAGEALERLQRAVAAAPGDPRAWYFLGGAQEASGLSAEAARSYEKALALSIPPTNWLTKAMVRWAALAAGRARLAAGDAAGAVPLLTRAKDEDPFRAWTQYELARAEAMLGKGDAALEALQKAQGLEDELVALEPRLPDPAKDPAFKAFAKDPAWADVFGAGETPPPSTGPVHQRS